MSICEIRVPTYKRPQIAIKANAKHTLEKQLLSAFYLNYQFEELSYFKIIQYLCKYGLRYFVFKSTFQNLLINTERVG